MLSTLNLIRWKNLLMIALVQLLIKYALLEPFGASLTLSGVGIGLLIIATLCIAAAGNIINDINDVETDSINKPNKVIIGKLISEKAGYNLFLIFNLIGVSLGFYLSYSIEKHAFFSIFVVTSLLLYLYATYLKQLLIIGNIVVALLIALSLILVGIFDLLPGTTPQNKDTQLIFFKIIMDYAIFAFTINIIREIAKDIEDVNGDHKTGMYTLPIAIGRDRANIVLFVLSFIPLIGTIYYTISTLYKNPIAVLYFLIGIIAPLLYSTIKIFNAKSQKDYHHISNTLKFVMVCGMLSLLLYKYILLA
ncbi:geranylgeranylglycerol-phosphate geranylgeranyltransferase [Snuella sedimenti]|uniref:Geranylgeranylglycerol-phosphate geranylgeranyltransferase n=1 Tax=Snuella sedimenti TaxID=2798802 RepID=A0A8J7IGR2_9FLAO|nr:geranylgeranylglycerol-phosphate geranylgeranyltransferase [Snuella sedimenti]MBJ6367081.1 geranylgeranylglycerol-phosphate geranylgeranyltransferase [Snuella sedimenti]